MIETGLPGPSLPAGSVCNSDSADCCQELGPWRRKAQQFAAALIFPTRESPSDGSGPWPEEMSQGTHATPVHPLGPL